MLNQFKKSNLLQNATKLKDFFPAMFFLAGFVWDAITIGRHVVASDLYIFTGYLLGAGLILYAISRPSFVLAGTPNLPQRLQQWYSPSLPYLLLQFLFGSLLSALFILYFKSASHALALVMTMLLGALLVANEFLENEYRRFTLSWALFGLCAMLMFNFVLPFMLGSVHAVWFYLSTVLGAAMVIFLYKKTPNHLGNIWPVWLIAGVLMLAYTADMIPPVPLVKRDIVMAYDIQKKAGHYLLTQQRASWWVFWRKTSDDLQAPVGQRVYCFSSIFAPSGLQTRLYHHWQHYSEKQGWQTQSRIGFDLNGGRDDGYRGYTYKQNLSSGQWRVRVETENQKTIAIHEFSVDLGQHAPNLVVMRY